MINCVKCGEIRTLEQLRRNLRSCFSCEKARNAKNYQLNATKLKTYAKEYRANNPEKVKAANVKHHVENLVSNRQRSKDWATHNPEKARLRAARFKAANPEKHRTWSLLWKKQNRVAANMLHANRRAKQKNATPAWANPNNIEEFYFAANQLGMLTGDWYHVDHIVPLQSKLVCGLHCEANLQVLTASENAKKSNRYWPDMPGQF
jgi:hypothetical protein